MDKQKEKLKKMLEEERTKVKGYEELARLYVAYISILLRKLGATEKNAVDVSSEEVSRAMSRPEARAYRDDQGGWKLFCGEAE